MEIQVPKSK